MAFKVKTKKVKDKVLDRTAFKMKTISEDLDNEAFLQYGSKYNDLEKKEKLEIAKEYARGEKKTMAFGIKVKSSFPKSFRNEADAKDQKMKAYKMQTISEDLDNEAFLQYNSKYNDLGKKEKLEIAKKLIKRGYH